jgi:hypothetical protein
MPTVGSIFVFQGQEAMARTATGARPSVHLAAGTNFSTEGTAAGTMLITNVMEPLGGSFVGTGACSIAEDTTLAETCNLRNLRNLRNLGNRPGAGAATADAAVGNLDGNYADREHDQRGPLAEREAAAKQQH